MSGEGALSLDVRAQGSTKDTSAMNFSGSGKIQNATLRVPSLTKPVQIRNSDIRFSQNSAVLENVAASIGEKNANGSLTIRNFAAPQGQFAVNADKLNVTDLQQIYVATTSTPRRAAASHDFCSVVPAG